MAINGVFLAYFTDEIWVSKINLPQMLGSLVKSGIKTENTIPNSIWIFILVFIFVISRQTFDLENANVRWNAI
jgi:hypothetical protein